jgi:Mrp family chromosome partitioning ATPase
MTGQYSSHYETESKMTGETKCSSCDDSNCEAKQKRPDEKDKDFKERQALASRMCRIKHKLMVLSGKGGVGKSTVAVNLAASLVMAGKKVGLMDIDIHGPSIPKLLRLKNVPITGTDRTLDPVTAFRGLRVMSIGLLLRGRDEAVIWRGPMKYTLIKQFLKDVEWRELDYLVVDSPPGTGDEPLTIAQLIDNPDGAVIVTTPQELAVQDVRRSIMFCRQLELPVLGVIENMSGFSCPKCGEHIEVFGSGGGRLMAEDMGVPFLGSIPMEPQVVASGEEGKPLVHSHPHTETAKAFGRIIQKLLEPDLKAVEDRPLREKKQPRPLGG